MPTVNGITYQNKLSCGDITLRSMGHAAAATSLVEMDTYGQLLIAQWQSDPTRFVDPFMTIVAFGRYDAGTLKVGLTGDASYGTSDFIDWCMTQAKYLGFGWWREWAATPRKLYELELQDPTSPVTVADSNDWSAVDLMVQRCEEYGIQLQLNIPWPQSDGWGAGFWSNQQNNDLNAVLTNWVIPITTFLADRYKDKDTFVQIEPPNEPFSMGFNYDQAATIQIAVYDAVKAVAPNLRVNLVNQTREYYDAMLYDLQQAGALSKFDGHACIHCYPVAQEGYTSYGYPYWPITEVTNYAATLDNYGRNDVNIHIGEFWGSGWVGTAHGVPYDFGHSFPRTQADLDRRKFVIDTFMTQAATLDRLDAMCIWRLLARDDTTGKYYDFDVGDTWEGTICRYNPTFPPTGETLYDYILAKGLYVPPDLTPESIQTVAGQSGGIIKSVNGGSGGQVRRKKDHPTQWG